ncbi:conserved hypothetical protein [Lodderomyces elongisporus NRRL YB-4239]|uniref:BSD domain-containing protein n=1 Tax=Lodderomyces elongisporus (strain ATCC 11503 / CBS 2605 / JCM 1781 / NBRC 1676 / NRRL YB-4239) TaxID=379508 RepID=A5E224_LODEL|nr:conserved hypothetical protein [Lodderomyces elongisporus NRRL YB-4239]
MNMADPIPTETDIVEPKPTPAVKETKAELEKDAKEIEKEKEKLEPIESSGNSDNTSENGSKGDIDVNARTEKTIEALENEIDKAYTLVESKFQELWKETTVNAQVLQDKYNVDEYKESLFKQLNSMKANLADNQNLKSVTENLKSFEVQLKEMKLEDKFRIKEIANTADHALDVLDSKLEIVEKEASKYISSFSSFFSSIVTIKSDTPPPEQTEGKTRELLFSSNPHDYAHYGTTRYDNDLFKLHTMQTYYLDEGNDDNQEDGFKQFNVDLKTNDIEALLKKYPNTLTNTMNDLVPVKVSYNKFWYRYFKHDNKLKEMERQRKELLAKEKSEKKRGDKNNINTNDDGDEEGEEEDDEDNFNWDDDDEEEEDDDDGGKEASLAEASVKEKAERKKSGISIKDKPDIKNTEQNDSDQPESAETEDTGDENEEKDDEEEEDDDDWE